jgi:hypothetical protein
MKRRGIIILISDFNDTGYERAFRRAAVRHDLIPVLIEDRLERALPSARAILNAGLLEDPGAGDALADLSSDAFLSEYSAGRAAARRTTEQIFRSAGTDWIQVDPAGDIYGPVVRYFRKRERRLR